jgi:tryptophan synthase alpha chain
MSRLDQVFGRCKDENRAALVGYLTAGDPDLATSEQLLLDLAGKVDVLELGMPFSDPMADGPVIQAASERALKAGCHITDVFALCRKVRDAHPEIGIVLMGYANVPYAMGFDTFAERAATAGADGVLIVDIPPEEDDICAEALKKHALHRIVLLSPTSSEERISLASACASGFIYYVSLTGITGAEMGAVNDVKAQVETIRRHSDLPVCVGFGVKTPAQAEQIAAFAEGVVVGSHFVDQIASHLDDPQAIARSLDGAATAMRQATER